MSGAAVRQVVLDTETTGLDPGLGHRVIELACVEIVNRRLTDRVFHRYLNAGRASDPGALEVHGLTEEFLSDKPRFAEVCRDFLEFVQGAELLIHNAPFDLAFLDAELARLDLGPLTGSVHSVVDTLRLARDLHPGKRNGLDALCERYAVDNSARTLHGALLDARLLGEVYLAMTRGQDTLVMDAFEDTGTAAAARVDTASLDLPVLVASAAEMEAHERYLQQLDRASKGRCLWMQLEAGVPG